MEHRLALTEKTEFNATTPENVPLPIDPEDRLGMYRIILELNAVLD